MRTALIFPWLLLAPAAVQAGDPATDAAAAAEYERLSEQMEGYGARNAWDGVDRAFRQLQDLDGVTLTLEDWFLGAQAARSIGDALASQERLLAATAQAEEGLAEGESLDPRTFQWLGELSAHYGRVRLIRKTEGTLQAVTPPFQADRVAAIEHAARVLDKAGRFDGLLPAGDYRFGEVTFTVEVGVDPKDRQKVKLK